MTKLLYETEFLHLKQTQSPSGHAWFYAHRPNAKDIVVIAPVLKENEKINLILLETQRPPLMAENKAQICIEFPAGLVGDENKNETTLEAIQKELLEETGYQAENIEIVASMVTSSSGLTSETSTYAIANIKNPTLVQTPVSDGGIILNVLKIPLSEIDSWLEKQKNMGKSVSAQVYGLLYFVMQKYN